MSAENIQLENLLIIDGLQYVNWNRQLFEEARDGGVTTIHVTIAYWENTKETLANIGDWHRLFRQHADLIMPVKTAADVTEAMESGRVRTSTGGDLAASSTPISAQIPLRRLGDPADVAAAVLFLCSDAASQITGTTISADGGWTAK